MTFVDTSAWFAFVVEEDVDHAPACEWWNHNTEILLTTDYVVDELLRARGQYLRSQTVGDQLFDEVLADLHYLSEGDVHAAWSVFQRFSDKSWSFTDCTSYAVMQRLGIKQAWAYDVHFRQFGIGPVVG